MSTIFETNNSDKIIKHVLIEHDYYNAILFTHMFKYTLSNGGYLQIPYYMPNSIINPNLQYSANLTPQKYQATNLYIFKKTHIIAGIDYDAELVIENQSVKNKDKIYTCFLLKIKKFSKDDANDIDKLLKISKNPSTYYDDMGFHFNPLIGNQSKIIQYDSDVNKVLIFTTPIGIKEIEFGGYKTIPSSLMILKPSSYQIIQINQPIQSETKEGFQEGYEMMDCRLVDDKNVTRGDKTLTKLVEQDSLDNKIMGVIFSILMVIVIGWFASAPLYKYIVINQYKNHDQSTTFATFFIGLVFFIFGAALFFDGLSVKYPNTTESYFGAMVILLVVVSSVSIAFNRLDNNYNNGPALDYTKIGQGFLDMMAGVFTILRQPTYVFGSTKPMIIGILVWVVLLIVILSVVCFVGIKKDPDSIKKEKSQKGYINHLIGLIMGIGSIYGFILIMYYFHIAYELPKSSSVAS